MLKFHQANKQLRFNELLCSNEPFLKQEEPLNSFYLVASEGLYSSVITFIRRRDSTDGKVAASYPGDPGFETIRFHAMLQRVFDK